MMNLELIACLWEWWMLLVGYAALFLVTSFALALSVSAVCKLLRTIYSVFAGRCNGLDD